MDQAQAGFCGARSSLSPGRAASLGCAGGLHWAPVLGPFLSCDRPSAVSGHTHALVGWRGTCPVAAGRPASAEQVDTSGQSRRLDHASVFRGRGHVPTNHAPRPRRHGHPGFCTPVPAVLNGRARRTGGALPGRPPPWPPKAPRRSSQLSSPQEGPEEVPRHPGRPRSGLRMPKVVLAGQAFPESRPAGLGAGRHPTEVGVEWRGPRDSLRRGQRAGEAGW